ncbi:hypothetical protein PY365_30065 [Roseiarcaceae bacterium H3SJ34-1]|uniref:hypothetical protein n=1 Tax=Terripilifer ovatus TaxID=3032367 RepID=UPI003AB982EB|nr:hypothetical protein [Roseiarcaceae bacterium H3SJ34-1]
MAEIVTGSSMPHPGLGGGATARLASTCPDVRNPLQADEIVGVTTSWDSGAGAASLGGLLDGSPAGSLI